MTREERAVKHRSRQIHAAAWVILSFSLLSHAAYPAEDILRQPGRKPDEHAAKGGSGTVTLGYAQDAPPTAEMLRGKSLVDWLQAVADAIAGAGGGGDAGQVRALLTATVQAKLHDPKEGPWRVTLAVTDYKKHVGRQIDNAVQVQLNNEASAMKKLLEAWSKDLSEAETAKLKKEGRLSVTVISPLVVIGTWLPRPTLTLVVSREEQGVIEIVAAGDYIVPGSGANVVRYKWTPAAARPRSVKMEIFDNGGAPVRTIAGLPATYAAGKQYAEVTWNGCRDAAGTSFLTERSSPYRIKVTGTWSSSETSDELAGRKVKEWKFTFAIPDTEAFAGSGRSGTDGDTVTPALLVTNVQVTGGAEVTIPHYVVSAVDESGNALAAGKNVAVSLKRGPGAAEYYLLYTTPTAPADKPIQYTVKVAVPNESGAADKAGNHWDMDKNAAGIQRRIEWTFKIDPAGAFLKPGGGAGCDETISR